MRLAPTFCALVLAGLAVVASPAHSDAATSCATTLDKTSMTVGVGEANWNINVTAAATCAWSAVSDSSWLVVRSTMPAPPAGNGYAKIRAITNTTSAAKRVGHITVNGVVYTVTQGGCGTSCTTTPPPPPPPPPPPAPPTQGTLRVLQYNTHHGGWGTDNVWNPSRIIDWIMKANPDLVSLNEIEVGTSWSNGGSDVTLYKKLLETRTQQTWYAIFFEHDGRTSGNGNLILSRFPFVATASQLLSAHRSAVDATVVVNGRNINFTSTHFDNVSASNRLAEVQDLLPFEATLTDPRLVLGDMNAWPGTAEMKALVAAGYVDTWAAAAAAGKSVGNGITHGAHRIDYIYLSRGGASILDLQRVEIFDTADPATGIMPSDHNPVLAVFGVK